MFTVKRDKIKFLGISIYKRKNKGNKTNFYFLYIPVYSIFDVNNLKKHFLFGVPLVQIKYDDQTNCARQLPLGSQILHQMNQIPLKPKEKLRVHFLYIADSYWPSWDSLYNACLANANIDCKIIFLNTKGTPLHTSQYSHAEEFLKEKHLPYVEYKDYYPENTLPHVMIYQTPYNANYKIFKKVSPELITALGIRIVYLSYGIEHDVSVNNNHIQNLHYGHKVHELAWRIFVMHADIKEGFYHHCLTGGFHVRVFGHPKFDCYFNSKLSLPKELIAKANGRKIIAFQLHCYNDSDCPGAKHIHSVSFAQHRKILKLFSKYPQYLFVYTIHPAFRTRNIEKGFCTLTEYNDFITEIIKTKNTFLYTGNHQSLLNCADAFITEGSSLMIEMGFFKKSVLYVYDVPITHKPFAAKLITTYHHGHSHKDVANFLDNIVFKNDPLLNIRERYKSSVFPPNIYNGGIGQRIITDIFQAIRDESCNSSKD